MLQKSLPVYNRHDCKAYLEVVRLEKGGSALRVQRLSSTKPQLASYWVMWLRHRLLASGAPLVVGVVRDDRCLEVASVLGSVKLINTVRGIASELRPLPKLPMRRDNQRSKSNEQRWKFAPDHGITEETMYTVVVRLNSELPRGVVVRGDVWEGWSCPQAELVLSRPPSPRLASLTMAQLGKWVEWRFAEALATSRV